MIGELVDFARGVLTFDDATYTAHVWSRDALKRGLLLIAVIALLSGLFSFFGAVYNGFRQSDLDALKEEILQQIEQSMQFNPAWQDPKFQRYFRGSFEEGFAIAVEIEQLPSNLGFLPRGLGRFLQPLGAWLSRPLAWLGGWAWYTLWVLLFAKLLGGHATLERMLGATSLYIVPHIFDLVTDLVNSLSRIAGGAGCCFGSLGGLIGLITTIWGIAIYVKATATANEFDTAKALLATVLPVLLALLLIGLVALVAMIGVALSSR